MASRRPRRRAATSCAAVWLTAPPCHRLPRDRSPCRAGCRCSAPPDVGRSPECGLRVIIADGVTAGDFTCSDPAAAARTVFDATVAYHHPAHAPEWQAPGAGAALEAVCALLINGLRFR
ncbi:hypothetical protein [Streptomyces yatensis]|uniref:Tetracyclin repressor-like C-terminal domain-containing protein n=1 Tax=Streptomyces yatensis TaxID=155177 RepID=A0ABP4S2V1_9ACTN|nr:hypothetical protein [Streptomyces yatensis]